MYIVYCDICGKSQKDSFKGFEKFAEDGLTRCPECAKKYIEESKNKRRFIIDKLNQGGNRK